MEKSLTIFLTVFIAISFTGITCHGAEDVIYGCDKKVNGQGRAVKDAGQCRRSELTSWNQTGPREPPEHEGPEGPPGPQETSGTGNVWITHQGNAVALTDSVTQVMSLMVPAGTYAISAKVSVTNLDSAVQSAYCALSTGNISGVDLAGGAEDNEQVISLLDAATFASDTAITLSCLTLNGSVMDGVLAAIEVENLTQQSSLRKPK
jgi:hypothetical protein